MFCWTNHPWPSNDNSCFKSQSWELEVKYLINIFKLFNHAISFRHFLLLLLIKAKLSFRSHNSSKDSNPSPDPTPPGHVLKSPEYPRRTSAFGRRRSVTNNPSSRAPSRLSIKIMTTRLWSFGQRFIISLLILSVNLITNSLTFSELEISHFALILHSIFLSYKYSSFNKLSRPFLFCHHPRRVFCIRRLLVKALRPSWAPAWRWCWGGLHRGHQQSWGSLPWPIGVRARCPKIGQQPHELALPCPGPEAPCWALLPASVQQQAIVTLGNWIYERTFNTSAWELARPPSEHSASS